MSKGDKMNQKEISLAIKIMSNYGKSQTINQFDENSGVLYSEILKFEMQKSKKSLKNSIQDIKR